MNTIRCFACHEHHSTMGYPWVVSGRGRHYCSTDCIPRLGRYEGPGRTTLGKYQPPKPPRKEKA